MNFIRILFSFAFLILVLISSAIAQDDPVTLREGLYRSAPGGLTYEIRSVRSNSMMVRQWQTATPAPPAQKSAYFNSGGATLLADGVTWRTDNVDAAGYCCGNHVQFEFRVLSETSFQGLRYRYWQMGTPTPGENERWLPVGDETYNLVGELPAPRPRPLPTATPDVPAPPPPNMPDLKDSGARFSSMTGEVQIYHDGESPSQARFAKLDTVIYVMDHIITSEESTAIIGFKDLSTHLVKEESEIVVTTPPEKDSKIKLVMGTIWSNIKKMWKDGTMEVEMSQAVLGVKGTRFILEEKPGSSTTKVIEGSVVLTHKRTGRSVVVNAGYMVRATARGLGPVQTFVITPGAAAFR